MIRVTSFGRTPSEWRDRYNDRTERLIPFRWDEIPIKRIPAERKGPLPEEAEFLKKNKTAFVLVDSRGRDLSSDEFYSWLFKDSERHLVVGCALGFPKEFYAQAADQIRLSSLTFTHELAQVLLAESIYRSACQLKNHPFVK